MQSDVRADEGAPGTAMITGAGTGIGLEFVRQYVARDWRVIATFRGSEPSDALLSLAAERSAVRLQRMDVSDVSAVRAAAAALRNVPLDIVINNAGVSRAADGDLSKQNFGSYDFDLFDRIFSTNVRGPLAVAENFAANLQLGKHKKLISLSSQLGSLTDPFKTREINQSAFYAASKAALNREMQVVAGHLEAWRIIVLLIHPGVVRTDRYDEFAREKGETLSADLFISPTESVRRMIETIDRATLADTGSLVLSDGSALGW